MISILKNYSGDLVTPNLDVFNPLFRNIFIQPQPFSSKFFLTLKIMSYLPAEISQPTFVHSILLEAIQKSPIPFSHFSTKYLLFCSAFPSPQIVELLIDSLASKPKSLILAVKLLPQLQDKEPTLKKLLSINKSPSFSFTSKHVLHVFPFPEDPSSFDIFYDQIRRSADLSFIPVISSQKLTFSSVIALHSILQRQTDSFPHFKIEFLIDSLSSPHRLLPWICECICFLLSNSPDSASLIFDRHIHPVPLSFLFNSLFARLIFTQDFYRTSIDILNRSISDFSIHALTQLVLTPFVPVNITSFLSNLFSLLNSTFALSPLSLQIFQEHFSALIELSSSEIRENPCTLR